MPSLDATPSHRFRTVIVIIVILLIAAGAYALLRGGAPTVAFEAVPSAIGAQKFLTVSLQSGSGVAGVAVSFEQNGQQIPVVRRTFAPRRWFTNGAAPEVVHFGFQAGQAQHPNLKDGPAELVVTARSANLRGSAATVRSNVTIDTHPPAVYGLTDMVYVTQGGSALVVYHASANAARSGVEMDNLFFPGYRLPNARPAGDGQTMFCLVAFPWDAPTASTPHLVASDAAGNQAAANFPVKTFPKTFRERTLTIDDNFISRVVMPIIAQTPSISDQHDPVQNFLLVNRGLRRTDTQDLINAAAQTTPHFLWQGAFTPLSNAAVEAAFADRRAYSYHGQIIDHETHLGYDLAVVRHTPVKAANTGRVVWAKYFGIYGNCILLDHGYGLMSLYAHLNDFEVKAGDQVRKGQLIAHSDSTGLAGGDHLHFSMLLDGVQVNPIEWWDPHWIHDRIATKLAAFTTGPVSVAAPAMDQR
ncbi:MAG: M23 family metallopeptidase [Terriglobales bacterium]